MAIIVADNNQQGLFEIQQQAVAILAPFPGALKLIEMDTPSLKVTYDDTNMTPQQRAQVNSDLANLGLT